MPKNLIRRRNKFFLLLAGGAFLFFVGVSSVYADVINVSPNAKHANDDTGETVSEIISDDSGVNPDTLSAVAAGDGVYTVDKNAVMQFTTFDVSGISGGSTITGAVLHLQYGAENGYGGTNVVRYDAGSGLTSSGITPTDITGFSSDQTYNLFSAGVDTLSEIQNLDIEFTNNDGGSADAIHFDYLWITVTYTPPPTPTTTLGDGTDPGNSSIAPGDSATDLNAFTLQTDAGTDTVTAATVTLASGSSGGLSLVAITDNAGSITYCSQSNPASDAVSLSSCSIPVSTTLTSFKIRLTPKTHVNMPAPPGSTYTVTGTITSFTGTNSQSGNDTDSATITIDNASPANVTSASGSSGDTQISLSWTNPADSDFHSTVVLRRATTAVADTPVEGTTYIVGNTIGTAAVACVVASPTASCTDTGLTNGTAYHYKIFSRDSNGNYATGAVPTGSPLTPAAAADTAAPGAITNLAVSTVSSSSVGLTWTAPGDDGDTGTASSYDMRYSTSAITAGNFSSAAQATGEPTPSTASSSESMTVSGLSASTLYYFAIKTSDEVPNTSNISNVVSTTTSAAADTTAPGAVTNLAVSAVSASSVGLTWTAPGDDGDTGTANTYDVRYSTLLITSGNFSSATAAAGEPTPSVASSSESMTVSGLSASTLYYFAIKTSDEAPNASAISNVVSTTTGAAAAPTPVSETAPPQGSAPGRIIKISFSGLAYPGAKVEVLRKDTSAEDAPYLMVPLESHEAAGDGSFEISPGALVAEEYFFGLRAKDKDGRETRILPFSVDLRITDILEVKDILMPPTVGFEKMRIRKGDSLKILGYAALGSKTEIEIDGKIVSVASPNGSGYYSFATTTPQFSLGNHYARARQIDKSGKASNFSISRTFQISQLFLPRADFNRDEKINITDWSIFLFRWGSPDQSLRGTIDMDADGKIDVKDFSIFLKNIQ